MEENCELVYDGKAILAEGPSWDEPTQKLLWVDILGEKIHRFDPKTKHNETIKTGQKVGAAVTWTDNCVVAAMEHGFYKIQLEDGSQTALVDPEPTVTGNRFNDGKCDPAGRFWAGTMDMEEKQPTGSLYTLERDGTVTRKTGEITVSNGLAWSPDQQTMYHIDSPTRTVYAWAYDLDTGKITHRRVVKVIPEEEGFPDGMTVDSEGMLWVALWDGWKVIRIDPSGRRLREVKVPAARVTSCCFGGKERDELYITTATVGIEEESLKEQPNAGGLFRIKPGVQGLPTDRYNGGIY